MAAFGAALTVVLTVGVAVVVTVWLRTAIDPACLVASERVPSLGGGEPEVHAWSRYHVRYYAMALLFLAFDMEMVFMYPWAVVFVEEGLVALVEMLMFIAILLLGILYAWRERALEWA
ncbi:MAG: NADH-quinone oxidoreductase subunit A [Acidimicrobiales bacterium]